MWCTGKYRILNSSSVSQCAGCESLTRTVRRLIERSRENVKNFVFPSTPLCCALCVRFSSLDTRGPPKHAVRCCRWCFYDLHLIFHTSVSFRMGLLATLRSRSLSGSAIGVMVSHQLINWKLDFFSSLSFFGMWMTPRVSMTLSHNRMEWKKSKSIN